MSRLVEEFLRERNNDKGYLIEDGECAMYDYFYAPWREGKMPDGWKKIEVDEYNTNYEFYGTAKELATQIHDIIGGPKKYHFEELKRLASSEFVTLYGHDEQSQVVVSKLK